VATDESVCTSRTRPHSVPQNTFVAITARWYLRTDDPVAQHLMPKLIAAIIDRYPAATAVRTGDGVGWVACDLASNRDVAGETRARYPGAIGNEVTTSPIALRISTVPDTIKQAVEYGLSNGGPDTLRRCDALAEATVSGYIADWAIVETVHLAAVELWAAVAYTDQAGFDVRVNDPRRPNP